ncbi:serine/threonine protein kinase [Hamadaea flava]|uniref:Serine/threonine-protein kinase n=1 Tax=Hamadaea flava TaxID=1742688 RepID=A0ABV8M3M5_9ACTN|nr:serine/threonine-protein kinase [Hamadaea flava]MCP2328609.1 serine/threonine protein kinase [Hamadaea flava]
MTLLDHRYRLGERLGVGGFGEVFLAQDVKMNRDVAVKMLRDEADPADLARLLREAKVLAGIRHPNIVYILDVGANYLVMERLTGPDLLTLAKARLPFAVEEAASYGVVLAGALTVLHERAEPIVHRDVKPHNIMLDGAPGSQQVKLVDFGLATTPQLPQVTESGQLVGTLAYMAPEQLARHRAGPPADVYSLGVTLYLLLSGSMPSDPLAQPPVPPRPLLRLRPELPPALAGIVHRMLAVDPAERPRAAEVREGLAALGGAQAAAEAVASRLAGQFTDVQALFGAGRAKRAAFALVRLLARAEAELGPDHSLVRRMHDYALTRTP